MKKFAIFGCSGGDHWSGESFLGFLEAKDKDEAESFGFDLIECNCAEENEEDDSEDGFEVECTCYTKAVEVADNITRYDWYTKKFFTEEEYCISLAKEEHRSIKVAERRLEAIAREHEKLKEEEANLKGLMRQARERETEYLLRATEARKQNSY